MTPRIAPARPIRDGGSARPPVKWMKPWGLKPGGCGWTGSKRGVERKIYHRLLKPPTCIASVPCPKNVMMRFRVHIRRNGSFWAHAFRGVFGRADVGVCCISRVADAAKSSLGTAIYPASSLMFWRRMCRRIHLPTRRPGSNLSLQSSLVSSRKRKTERQPKNKNMAHIRFGNAYGHLFIHCTPSLPPILEPGPKIDG